MSLQVEKLEKNMAKLTIEVDAAKVTEAIKKAYDKNKGKMSVPGFRKGKVPQAMIEKMYGPEVFYEDAANFMIPDAYAEEVDNNKELEIVSQPKIDVVQLEKGKNFIFTAEVALKPPVELGKYKGVKIDKIETEVTDEDIDKEIKREQEANARTITVTDRAVKDGDTAVIDFEGFMDGVAFEGGKGDNYPLVIGSHSFIPGFEEQIIGKNTGDEIDVNVTFPEDYNAKDLFRGAFLRDQIKYQNGNGKTDLFQQNTDHGIYRLLCRSDHQSGHRGDHQRFQDGYSRGNGRYAGQDHDKRLCKETSEPGIVA